MSNERKTERGKLFGILTPIILQLEKMGGLILLKMKEPGRKTKTKIPTNVYFKVAGHDNLVWMHVQSGYGVFISHYVTTINGQKIDLVQELSKYYWYIAEDTNEVMGSIDSIVELENMLPMEYWNIVDKICKENILVRKRQEYLYRAIGSVILYGNINVKMPTQLEVHHKILKWCHVQDAITFAFKIDHDLYHDEIASRESHQPGKLICSLKDMMSALDELIKDINEKKNSPM